MDGDTETVQIYPVEPSGVTNSPWQSVDWSSDAIKLGVGLRTAEKPTGGTFTVTDGAGYATSALAFDVSTADLATALNGLYQINTEGGVTVTGTVGDYYIITYVTAGAKTAIGSADGTLLTPYGTASVSEIVAGASGVKEKWLLLIRANELVEEGTWAAVAAVAKSVTVVSAGSGSTTGVQTFDFSRPAVGGVFNIEFNSVTKWFDWNATVAQVQAAFGSDYAVTGNDGGPWTIEKVANGAVATGDMDVSKLDALDGWQATVKMNTPAMVQYMLDQTETEVIQYLEVQAGTAAAPLTVYQDEVTVTKDVINQ